GVRDVGDAAPDPVEVLQRQLDPGLVGDGHEVEHGVGGTTEGHDHGDGVFERRPGHYLSGPDAQLQELYHGPAALVGVVVTAAVDGGGAAAAGKGHAQSLGHRGHGVG